MLPPPPQTKWPPVGCLLAIAVIAAVACHRGPALSPTAPTATADGAARLPDFPSPAYWTTAGPYARLPLVSAHRGRPELPNYPENALESIERLHEAGDFIAEIDVARSADGVLFLFHDWDLDRLTVHEGDPGERTWADLDTMRVYAPDGTLSPYTIPSLAEVLDFAKGRLLLSLDRKGATTYRQLYNAARERDMLDHVSLILYDDADLAAYTALPSRSPMNLSADTVLVVRAMAAACSEWHTAKPCPVNLFLGVGALSADLLAATATAGLRDIFGTFGELDAAARADGGATYRRLVAKGVDVLATNRPLSAARAIYAAELGAASAGVGGFGETEDSRQQSPTAPAENTSVPE